MCECGHGCICIQNNAHAGTCVFLSHDKFDVAIVSSLAAYIYSLITNPSRPNHALVTRVA